MQHGIVRCLTNVNWLPPTHYSSPPTVKYHMVIFPRNYGNCNNNDRSYAPSIKRRHGPTCLPGEKIVGEKKGAQRWSCVREPGIKCNRAGKHRVGYMPGSRFRLGLYSKNVIMVLFTSFAVKTPAATVRFAFFPFASRHESNRYPIPHT